VRGDKDGENGLVCLGDGETYVIPVEICETRYGVLVDQFALDIADGGAGRFRGGRGLVRDYRILSDSAFFTGTFGRHKYLPWGMQGGRAGSRNYSQVLYADGRASDPVGKSAQTPLKKNDVVRLVTHGRRLRRPRRSPCRLQSRT
jgi:N-methylhydantoinase B